MVICKGCGSSFTNVGWPNHLSQTKDLKCITAHDEEASEFDVFAGFISTASGSTAHGSDFTAPECSVDTFEPEDVDMDLPDLTHFRPG